MPYVHTPSARVHFSVEGSGPALMLLHGTGGDGFSHWGPLMRYLSPRHTVICPDYAGSGQTVDDGGPLQLDTLIAQVLAVADNCSQQQLDLVGYSLGAVIAAMIAARHPDRVRRLVLVAGFVGGEDSRAALQFGLWRDLIARDHQLMARFILLTGCSPAWLSAQSKPQLNQRLTAILRHTNWDGMARQTELDRHIDIRTELAGIRAPTQVITAAHDHMVPTPQSDALIAGIAGASSLTLDAGHLLPIEQPRALAEAILAFVNVR